MDFFPFASILASAFIGLLCLTLLLNILSLPANWLILGLIAIWHFVFPMAGNYNLWFWILVIGLAVIGEVLETALQLMKAKRYGSSSSGTWAGLVGGIIGAIMLAPLFWGIGALIGALAGAWLACFGIELLRGRPTDEALDAAFGTLLGRLLGTLCKIGTGAVIIAITAHQIWPESPTPIPLPEEHLVWLAKGLPA